MTASRKVCSPCAQTVVLLYKDFGPPVAIYKLDIGSAWNPWRHEDPEFHEVDIHVVVYRGIALEEVKKQFPVIRGKSDFRYLEYARAIQFLQEEITNVEGYKQNASEEPELKIWDDLLQLLKKSHERIIENLGV